VGIRGGNGYQSGSGRWAYCGLGSSKGAREYVTEQSGARSIGVRDKNISALLITDYYRLATL
jgi:hypothetical protein